LSGPYLPGRFRQTLGWITLGQKQYDKAASHFAHSIEIFSRISNKENSAKSQAGLARTKLGLGNRQAARQLLQEAIATATKIQAYIPMVFTLPVTLLLLVEEDIQFAKKIYRQVRRDGFMSNAPLFHDLVYQHLPDEITSIPVETVEHNDEHREALWKTAEELLNELQAFGWGN
jgi:hypothetical protein